MTVEIDAIYPNEGGKYFQVSYYSKEFLNKEMAKIHSENLKEFLKKESIRINLDEKLFLKALKGKK